MPATPNKKIDGYLPSLIVKLAEDSADIGRHHRIPHVGEQYGQYLAASRIGMFLDKPQSAIDCRKVSGFGNFVLHRSVVLSWFVRRYQKLSAASRQAV